MRASQFHNGPHLPPLRSARPPTFQAFSKLLARLGTTMDRLVANQTLITSLVNLHISVGKAMWRGELLVPGTQVTTMGGTVLSTKW